ncbi:ABC transporter permease [Nesterenkonia sandarakina]|uniref:Putative ABC transport system permease protein n=2 Tax=Nesterenkonia sandarakina TaxID=272918 RepID=A0A7Z0J4K6_9MICC|nr:putative ABC transport system permease protein [Nesterenkonia sandarakina]
MRPSTFFAESLKTAWANKVPSALIMVLVAVMCATTLATVGRTAAAESLLADRLNSAGSRIITITEPAANSQGLINPATVSQASHLSTVDRAIGSLTAIDVLNGPIGDGGTRVPAWGIEGSLEDVMTLTAGRWPMPGEALVSHTAMEDLGMDHPAGWVQSPASDSGENWSVVGMFEPRPPFERYDAGIIYPTEPETNELTTLHVISTNSRVVGATQMTLLSMLDPPAPDHLTVNSPVSLAALQTELSSDFTTFSRALLFGVFGTGGLLVATVTLADVLVRRADLGRRRALGATRTIITALVVTRTLIPSLLGATIGAIVGVGLTIALEAIPPWEFVLGTAVLAVLTTTLSAVAPAVYASRQDPVRVLRTP